jgi:hypothetical protein
MYFFLKYFHLNEKFILLKDSSDRIRSEFFIKTRIGFGLDNFSHVRLFMIMFNTRNKSGISTHPCIILYILNHTCMYVEIVGKKLKQSVGIANTSITPESCGI